MPSVKVRDNEPFDVALRRFKRSCEKAGILSEVRRREHNRLGFALQLCLMRYPGRALIANEALPMPMLNHVAEQVGADPASFELYARREETRMNHVARLLGYLEMRSPTGEDRIDARRSWQLSKQLQRPTRER